MKSGFSLSILRERETVKRRRKMSVITNECDCHIALTIEKQLKKYSECPGHTDRHEILWHEWNHNKRWLARIHELILPSFRITACTIPLTRRVCCIILNCFWARKPFPNCRRRIALSFCIRFISMISGCALPVKNGRAW